MSEYIVGNLQTTPDKARYNIDRMQLLADYYKKLVDKGRVQAAGFLLARKGEIFAHQTIGNLNHKADSPPYKPDSIKGIASVSKIFTSAAIMKLIEDGVLWLDQPVSTIIKEFKNPMLEKINLRHLMTHTSGLMADPGYFLEPYGFDLFEKLFEKDWLKNVLVGPLQAKPGEQWSYCTLGFNILAEIVSRVSGKHFNDYMQEEIFATLAMTRSFMEIPKKLIHETCTNNDWQEEIIINSTERDTDQSPFGGGGVYSTLEDLFKFGQCFINGGTFEGHRLLSKTTCETMTTNHLKNVPAFHWGDVSKNYKQGLGWGFSCNGPTVGPQVYNHEGFGWSSLFVDPKEEFVYVSMVVDAKDWDPEVMVKPRTIAWSGIE